MGRPRQKYRIDDYGRKVTARLSKRMFGGVEFIANASYRGKLSRVVKVALARFLAYEYSLRGEKGVKADPLYWLAEDEPTRTPITLACFEEAAKMFREGALKRER